MYGGGRGGGGRGRGGRYGGGGGGGGRRGGGGGGPHGGYGMGPGADTAHLRHHKMARIDGGHDPGLKQRIVAAGDERPSLLEPSVLALADDLNHAVADGQTDYILDTILKCVCKLGSKVPVYGTLVGLVNQEFPDFGKKMINRVHLRLEAACERDDFVQQKLLLRTAAELCNSGVLYMSGLIGLLNDFLGVSRDLNAQPRRRDISALLVMATLPWCCERLREEKREELEEVFAHLKAHMDLRPPANDVLGGHLYVLQAMPLEDEGPMDLLEEAWVMAQQLLAARWLRPECLVTPITAGRIPGRLQRLSVQHQIPTLHFQGTDTKPKTWKRIPVSFRLMPTLSEVPPVLKWVTQDQVQDTLLFFAGSRDRFEPDLRDLPGVGGLKGCVLEGAKQILNLPSVPKFEGVVVETIIGQIMCLPHTQHQVVFYGAMVAELCKLQSTIHPPLGAAINYLFNKIPVLQVECVDRFLEWLSFHLSNFDFQWLWADWVKVASQPQHDPQRRFVVTLLERCTRLSYFEKLHSVLTAASAPALAALMHNDLSAVFPYTDDHPLHAPASELQDMVSLAKRCENAALEEFVRTKLSDLQTEAPAADRAKVVVCGMVYEGRESFSHLLGILGRYLPVLKSVIDSKEEEQAAAQAVAEVWVRSTQSCVMVMDKLVAMKLMSPITLVQWLLADYTAALQRQAYMWELLFLCISKPVALVRTVKGDLAKTQREIDDLQAGSGSPEEIEEKEGLKSRIKAVLRNALSDQDAILVAAMKGLVLLANLAAAKRAGHAQTMQTDAHDDDDAAQGEGEEAGKGEGKGADGGEHGVWFRELCGRLMQLGRRYGEQLRECREALEEELGALDIEDPQLKQLVVTVQSMR